MELEKLAMLISEEFVKVFAEACDRIMEPEADCEALPKVMRAGS